MKARVKGLPQTVLERASQACFALANFNLLNENANSIRAIRSLRWCLNGFLACPHIDHLSSDSQSFIFHRSVKNI